MTGLLLQRLDLAELTVQAHLELALVADDVGGLAHQLFVLLLGILDRLLDLDLGVGSLVHLRAEPGREVLPGPHEWVGLRPMLCPPEPNRHSR